MSDQPVRRYYVDIVFDGPSGHIPGRFVEVENQDGASIQFGEWVHREDGYWVLRFVSRNLSIDEFIGIDQPVKRPNLSEYAQAQIVYMDTLKQRNAELEERWVANSNSRVKVAEYEGDIIPTLTNRIAELEAESEELAAKCGELESQVTWTYEVGIAEQAETIARLQGALEKNERTAEQGVNTGEVDKQYIYLDHTKRDSHATLTEEIPNNH